MQTNHTHYDLIGDIHGFAGPLRGLLAQLGYVERDGVFRHPTRRVIFLGDFIDRGPAIRETLHIVRAMTDAGSGRAVMGNHEYNALCMHTPGPAGGWLMARTPAKLDHHQATIDAFAGRGDEWRECLAWMMTLPLALDLGRFRAAHAAWDESALATLPRDWRLTPEFLRASRVPESAEFRAVEVLLKGLEVPLPAGVTLRDKSGHARAEMRVRWWLPPAGLTYAALALPHHADAPADLLDGAHARWPGYPAEAPPVFLGHYWLPPEKIALLAPNVACLDYSVGTGGPLVAYRWEGERALDPTHFVAGPRGSDWRLAPRAQAVTSLATA